MKVEPKPTTPATGLSALAEVTLNASNQQLLDFAARSAGGPAAWCHRKLKEAKELLALSQITNRLRIEWLDLFDPLRVLFVLRVPVPCVPDSAGQLRVADHARIGLTFRQEALRLPQPGCAQILWPRDVWHANVALGHGHLCLGPIATGTPIKELVLMTYGALSMQAIQIDAFDAAGVLNLAAARWWQENVRLIPLTRAPFLCAGETKP